MKNTAVILVSSGLPSDSSGGPPGFIYLLIKSLMPELAQSQVDLYLLMMQTNELIAIGPNADLAGIVANSASQLGASVPKERMQMQQSLNESRSAIVRYVYTLARKWKYARQVPKLRGILSGLRARYDSVVVHGHEFRGTHRMLRAAQGLTGVSLIHTEHSKGGVNREKTQLFGDGLAKDSSVVWITRQYHEIIEGSDAFTFPSDAACELFESYNGKFIASGRRKVSTLYSGVEVGTPAQGKPLQTPPVLFAVAQHVPEKGIDRMLVALATCKQRGVVLHLRIAGGETQLSPTLYQQVESLGLKEQVSFLGVVPRSVILKEMEAADIILACPRVVVFDLSLLEAMGMGKAIVTSKLGGNIEALGVDYPGLFAEDDELPSLLARLVTDSDALRQMATHSRKRYEDEFTLPRMAERYLDLYAQFSHSDGREAMKGAVVNG